MLRMSSALEELPPQTGLAVRDESLHRGHIVHVALGFNQPR